MADAASEALKQTREVAGQETLAKHWGRLGSIGIRRYIKIKADANPYLREYAFYFWRRRHDKESRLLPTMSAREYWAMIGGNQPGRSPRASFGNA